MVGGIYIICFLGTLPYGLSAPGSEANTLDEINIKIGEGNNGKSYQPPGGNSAVNCPTDAPGDLIEAVANGELTVVDTRSNVSREAHGYITGSIWASELMSEGSPQDLDIADVVFLVDASQVAKKICNKQVVCYCGNPAAFGDKLILPETVSSLALQLLLEDDSVLLVDVRNRTELVNPGRIPNSVNVPLHEIPQAFYLSKEEFRGKYGFDLPEKDVKNLVLTCRLGRRILTAQARLKDLGYCHLRLHRESFTGWVSRGLRIIKGNRK